MNDFVLACLRAIYQKKALVAVVVVIAFLAVAVKELLVPLPYTAETVLVVTNVPFGSDVGAQMPEPFNPKVYEMLAMSTGTLGQVLEALTQYNAFTDEPPELDAFSKMVEVELEVVDQTTRPVNYSPLLVLRATGETEEQAKAIAEQWANTTIDAAYEANLRRISAGAELLSSTGRAYEEDLHKIRQQQSEEMAKYDLELIRFEVEKREEHIYSMKEQLVKANIDLAVARQQLTTAQTQFGEEVEIKTLLKAPTDTAVYLSSKELGDRAMATQEINPVFIELKTKVNDSQLKVAGLEVQLTELQSRLDELQTQQAQAQEVLASHRFIQTNLETNEDYKKKAYQSLAQLDSFVAAAKTLIQGRGAQDQLLAVGLNRLSERTFAMEERGLLGRKGRVLLVTMVAFLLASTYACWPVLTHPLLAQMQEQDRKAAAQRAQNAAKA